MVRYLLQMGLLLAVAVYAWRRGGWPEKAAAAALVAHVVLDRFYHALFETRGGDYTGLHPWHFTLDLALLAVVLVIALRANRFWTLWLGSAQILAVTGHLLRLLESTMHPNIYAILERYPFWMCILLVGIGTANHHRVTHGLARRNPL